MRLLDAGWAKGAGVGNDVLMSDAAAPSAQDEVATFVSELITIDSSNYGNDDGPGEIAAADYVAQRLAEVGLDAERFTTTSDKRAGVVLRYPGRNPDRGALLVHGHLDVVPAPEPDWVHPAFSGVIDGDGVIWGRGAVDMKDMDGMMLALIRDWQRRGVRPDRDIVFLWLPDEEAGGTHGAFWLTEHRSDIFAGVTEAIGEVGGFSLHVSDDLRLYPIMTAEKGLLWLRLAAHGQAGHGSFINNDSAIDKICAAATRLAAHEFPTELTPASRALLERVSEITELELPIDNPAELTRQLGALGTVIGSATRNTMNVTMLEAGFKANVVPASASATVDCRFVPGAQERALETIRGLVGSEISIESIQTVRAVETPVDGPLLAQMTAALRSQDDGAVSVPYMMTGGTDAKAFFELGIRCFGFSPLKLTPDLDFFGMFHNVNERVPVAAVQFGVRVLDRFLRTA